MHPIISVTSEAEALPTGESDKDLEILFRFTELRRLSQIVFVGTGGTQGTRAFPGDILESR